MQSDRALIRIVAAILLPVAVAAAVPPACAASDAERPAPPVTEVVDRVRTKVVVLKTSRGRLQRSATGFLARPGYVLTVAHAVTDVTAVIAWVNGVRYRTDVVATDPELDVALVALQAPELLLKPAQIAASSADLRAEEPLVILAGPSQAAGAKSDPTTRVPIPAAFQRRTTLRTASGRPLSVLRMHATVERGDSGSPVLRAEDGAVVGLLTSRELPGEDGVSETAYALPSEAMLGWLQGVLPARSARSAAPSVSDLFLAPAGG